MSADAQSAFGNEYRSAANRSINRSTNPSIRSNAHYQSNILQQRATAFDSPSSNSSLANASLTVNRDTQTVLSPAQASGTAAALSTSPVPSPTEQQTFPVASTLLQKLQGQVHGTLADQITPLRLAGHLSVLGVAAIILLLSQITIPDWNLPLGGLSNNVLASQVDASSQLNVPTLLTTELQNGSESIESLQRIALPFTTVPEAEPRVTIDVHVVKPGETVLGIAAQYGLQPETIMWANPAIESNPDRISIGDKLNVLPVNGVLHTVRNGDTLSAIAAKYKVEMEAITGYEYNQLADAAANLTAGQELIIPGGEKPLVAQQVVTYNSSVPASATKGSGAFAWPASGNVSQGYWGGHAALDISSWTGSPVKSADGGHVIYVGSGWSSGYGNHIIVDHGNGYTTLYAHLNSIFVNVGENVGKGQQIGSVGNTGNSTGPHLHFEIRYQGVRRNPYSFLP